MSFRVKAVTEGDDSYFEQWVKQQLNAMMGVGPAQEPLGGTLMMAQSNRVPAQFAAELSKGLAMGLKLLGPLKSPTTAQGGHTNTDTKWGYRDEDIAMLMDFAHVKHSNQLLTICEYFDSYQGKSIDTVWRQLYARMKQWFHDRHIPIKVSMYLEETTIKALIELKFNPGEGSPTSAQRIRDCPLCAARDAQAQRWRVLENARTLCWQWRTHGS